VSSGRWKNSKCKRIKLARKKARAVKRDKKNRAKIARMRKDIAKNSAEKAYRKHWLSSLTQQLAPNDPPSP
jgi:hypothetical protein